MTTVIIFHEVIDGERWASAWRKGPNSRHEMFAKYGIKARTFRDPQNPKSTGIFAEIADMKKFQDVMASEEGKRAMAEDGLKVETMRMLTEFTP
jgi:hypothetical protein